MKEHRNKKKKSVQLFYDSIERILNSSLSDEEFGRLYRAIFRYELYGGLPDFQNETRQDLMSFMFNTEKDSLDNQMGKYDETCKRNQRNRTDENNDES